MTDAMSFDPSPDVLYHGVALRHVTELPVLGIPVRYESNSATALAVVEEAFGVWRGLCANPHLIAPHGVRVRLIVHDGDERGAGAAGSHALVTCRMPDADRVIVHTPGSVGIADASRKEAIAYITPALLAGPPGTGKSTLAYQAHRHGLRVLSDDAVYVQLDPMFRVWGLPGRLRLLTTAVSHFPELAGRSPTFLANGDEQLVVQCPGEWPAATAAAPVATRAGVCLLDRSGTVASKASASTAEVQAFLKDGMGLSRVRFGASLDEALRRLAGAGGWRVSLSTNPADAMPMLDEILAELESET